MVLEKVVGKKTLYWYDSQVPSHLVYAVRGDAGGGVRACSTRITLPRIERNSAFPLVSEEYEMRKFVSRVRLRWRMAWTFADLSGFTTKSLKMWKACSLIVLESLRRRFMCSARTLALRPGSDNASSIYASLRSMVWRKASACLQVA